MKERSRVAGFEVEIFKLVREHADTRQWSRWLQAPLELAAAKGDIGLFTALMDAGAEVGGDGFLGRHGRTLIGAAAAYGGKSEEIVQMLVHAGDVDGVDVRFGLKQESALHVAAFCGVEEVSNALILAGASPGVTDRDEQSPLHLAAEEGHDGVVDVLLLNGADPNAKGSVKYNKQTPRHRAAAEGHALCVSKLVGGGAGMDSRDREGKTPLHLAAQNNHLGVVEALSAAGADLDAHDKYCPRHTVLDIAAKRGYVDVVRALLKHGSRVNNPSQFAGYTALHRAAGSSRRPTDGVEHLPMRRKAWTARGSGRPVDNSAVIRLLLEAGADIEAKTAHDGRTPLHLAASSDSSRSSSNVRTLLQGGANVNARSAAGDTPLHHACYRSSASVVELLLRSEADEKLTNSDGETPEDTLGCFVVRREDRDRGMQRDADDRRIRYMLARAPADRSWRRRGWLVLARFCSGKVQLAMEGNSDGGGGGGSGSSNDADGGSSRTGEETRADLERLVGRVVGLDEEDVFRLVLGFL